MLLLSNYRINAPALSSMKMRLINFIIFKRSYFQIALLSFIFLTVANRVEASHASGGQISYECLGNNQYRITASFYRDCAGIAAPSPLVVNISSVSCGVNLSINLTQISVTNVIPACSTAATTCNGGTLQGYQEYIYQGTITLPQQCADWVFSYDVPARNAAVTNLTTAANFDLYVEARLNNLTPPNGGGCFNSPSYSAPCTFYVCACQPFSYSQGTINSTGDLLVYDLVPARSGVNTNMTYCCGLSGADPIAPNGSITIDSTTGDISINTCTQQVAVISIRVRQYHNGVLIGTTTRDIEVVVYPCTNQLPTLTGINGLPYATAHELTVCPGSQVCFDVNSDDPDAGQIVTLTGGNLVGVTFTQTGSPHPVGHFCWTPTVGGNYVYNITVRDDNCPINGQQIYPFLIHVTTLSPATSVTSISCFGGNNGSVTATVTAGTPPYTYTWNTGSTNNTISGLTAGTYTVHITDSINCVVTVNVVVAQPPALSTSTGTTNISCSGGGGGAVAVLAGGGTSPFSYHWSNGATTSSNQGLSNGNYCVTVTDFRACTTTACVTLTDPAPIVITTSQLAGSCSGGSTGQASASASGGTGTYNYLWNNAATGTSIVGLAAGTYTVTVTDSHSCSATQSITISSSPAFTLSTTTTNNTNPCSGTCNGGGTVSILSGGVSPFSYQWSTGPNDTLNSVAGLCGGSYFVTVSDAIGCSSIATIQPTQPGLNLVGDSTSIQCFGGTAGGASVSAGGGGTSFQYIWSNNATTSAISGLSAGLYTVTVSDNLGCHSSLSINVSEPPDLILTPSAIPSCAGPATGSATVSVVGGTPAYNYTWSNTGNTSTISNLSGATYTVTVSDAHDCTASTSIVVGAIPNIQVNSPGLCLGQSNASLTASGGITYTWLPSISLTSTTGDTTTAFPTGTRTYTVIGTNSFGCSNAAVSTVTVHQLPNILANSTPSNGLICAGTCATITATGGTGATYTWSPTAGLIPTSGIGAVVTACPSTITNYTVRGVDQFGCYRDTSRLITIKLTPDFSFNGSTICRGGCTTMSLIYSNSTSILYTWQPGNIIGANPTFCPTNTTVYTVTGNLNSCITTHTYTITVNQPPNIVVVPNPASNCNGSPICLTANGGLTYDWSPSTGLNTTAGPVVCDTSIGNHTYTVVSHDLNGCSGSRTVNVSIGNLALSVPPSYDICENGVAHLCATGNGTFSWTPSIFLSCDTCACTDANPPATQCYTLTLTSGSCSTSTQVCVNMVTPPVPTVHVNGGDTIVCDTVSGFHIVSYQWNFNGFPISGATDSTYLCGGQGTYSVRVFYPNGCNALSAGLICPVGIQELSFADEEIGLYPNPSQGTVTITGWTSGKWVNISILNMLSQVVFETDDKHPHSDIHLDVSSLAAGMYIVRLETTDKLYRTKLVIERN